MLFVQLHAPQCGLGLAPPEPARPLSGLPFVGHLPGLFGLGFPARVRRPAFVEDTSAFLGDWGEPLEIDGVDAGCGIFSNPYATDPLGSVGMAASGPRVLMPSAGVPPRDPADPTDPVLELADRRGEFDARNRPVPFRYLVREIQPDGTGWSSLILDQHPDQTVQ